MPSQDLKSADELEKSFFEAIEAKDLDRVRELYNKYPNLNLDCVDENELTPLQHACHTGQVELVKFLLDSGAGVNFTSRKDGYTPLMFAAISARADIVRLLLERGVDISPENCVNRTASQMAGFVGQTKIVSIIQSWVPFETSVEPFTKCRELESKPRLSSMESARLLHNLIVYSSVHPVKLLLYIRENPTIVKNAPEYLFVLDALTSKSFKPPQNDETIALKYYYLSYIIKTCRKAYDAKFPQVENNNGNMDFNMQACDKCIEAICRKLIRRDPTDETKFGTKQIDQFILDCILKFPYTQLAIFKTMTFALSKFQLEHRSALTILKQTLCTGDVRWGGRNPEACNVCEELDKNKKCSKCKSTYYCGPPCQRIDWFQHKRVCKEQTDQKES